jgi:hypothetical protein
MKEKPQTTVPATILFSIAVALMIVRIGLTLGVGGAHVSKRVDIELALAVLIFLMLAVGLRFGSALWDRRLLPWGAKSRP